MSQPPDPDPPHIDNTMTGQVSGNLVMAGTIHDGVHFYAAARQAMPMPYRHGTVPQRAGSFQRRAIISDLAEAVDTGDAVMPTSDGPATTTVLCGLGGVGKTQLAADYAETAWASAELDLLVWITATSRDAIVSGYARLATDLTGTEDPDPYRGAHRLLAWLSTTNARWLVVLDDVQSPADLRDLWPSPTPTGRILVTTRRRDAALRGHRRRLIEVDVFTAAEAVAYLTGTLTDRPHLLDEAAELVVDLGYLPLALAQAAAYMLDRDLCCARYRARLADRRRQLAGLLPEPESLPDEHRATVTATWSLAVEQANRLEPTDVAGAVLEIASVLDANGIPAEVFTAPTVLALLTAAAGREIDAELARDGLGCARRLSLITLDHEVVRPTVHVHALLQRVTRDGMAADRLPVLVRAAADALMWAWPEIERDAAAGQILRTNVGAVAAVGWRYLWEPVVHPVLFRAGHSLGDAGLVAPARDYFGQLNNEALKYLGADHPATLSTHHDLAYWRGEAGDHAGAAAMFEQLLADRFRVLGPNHPDTLATRYYLAMQRGRTGDRVGAATALEEVLAEQLRLLGPDHPNTMATRHLLAFERGQAGDHAGAAAAVEELLADRLRVLGPDHPAILSSRHNLAVERGAAGDPAGAAAALQDVLADQRRLMGPDHPDILVTRSNLAVQRGAAGDPAGAAAELEEILADQLRVFGPDHPVPLVTTRTALARCRGAAGDPAGAAAELEEILADQLRVFGPDHPITRHTRDNFADWQMRSSRPVDD